MNPDTIALLRAESLTATLTAARGRRVRRRVGRIALSALVFVAVALAIFPRRPPAPAAVAIARTAVAPVVVRETRIIHTAPAALVRVTTAGTSLVRFSTDSQSRVERIDNAGLASCFPDKGIAVIRTEGELAKVVMF